MPPAALKRHAAALLLGLLSACGFAPLDLWPLTIAAFAGLILLIRAAPRLRTALAVGWGFGFGQFVVGLNWIATAFTYQSAMPHWLGWIAVVLLSLYLAIYPAAATGLAWRWGRRDPLATTLALAAGWIVTEWLRATVFTGFAWNPVAVAMVPLPLVSDTARLIGTYGLSGLVILLAGVPLLLSGRRWLATILVLAGLTLAGLLAGAGREPLEPARDAPLVRVIQPNIGQQEKEADDYALTSLSRLAALSGWPTGRPRLLLWPEAATEYYLEEEKRARLAIAQLLGPRDIILTGGTAIEYGRDGTTPIGARNSLFAMNSGGRLLHRYDKSHLVPYGEYLPMRPILSRIGLSRLVPGNLDFWSGPGPKSYVLPGFGKVGVQICYEIIFSGLVVDRGDRPDFVFNPSNDAWFGAWGPPQHLAQARLRAIEEGLPVLRATPTGISALIDADGRVLNALPWRRAGRIDALVPPARAPMLFARGGNILPLLFAALLLLAAIAVEGKRR